MDKERLVEVILEELRVICEENEIDANDLSKDTILFGDNSIIDSLALVSLIVKLEEFMFEEYDKEVQVIDDEVVIVGDEVPFKNAVTLAELAIAQSNAK